MRKTGNRHNMAKVKILWSIKTIKTPDSVNIAYKCRQTVRQIVGNLNHLNKWGYIRKAITPVRNGCHFKYSLTEKGRDILKKLLIRFTNGDDLNFKHFPRPVKYAPEDYAFMRREFIPYELQATGTTRDLNLAWLSERRISQGTRALTFFHDPKINEGDTFKANFKEYIIHFIESFSLTDYAKIFYIYNQARTSHVFLKALVEKAGIKEPEKATVTIIYFTKFDKERHKPPPIEQIKEDTAPKIEAPQATATPATTTHPEAIPPRQTAPTPILEAPQPHPEAQRQLYVYGGRNTPRRDGDGMPRLIDFKFRAVLEKRILSGERTCFISISKFSPDDYFIIEDKTFILQSIEPITVTDAAKRFFYLEGFGTEAEYLEHWGKERSTEGAAYLITFTPMCERYIKTQSI